MLLEHCTVSRKTPLDGKLEITPEAAARLAPFGPELALVSAERQGTAQLSALACTCAKGAGGRHVHHFVESPLLRALIPGALVSVDLDEQERRLRVEPL
jgi:hypothetical protein